MQGSGEGEIDWNESAQHLPICKSVDRQGHVQPNNPMTNDVFFQVFTNLFKFEYSYVRKSTHMIRRELGKQIDGEHVTAARLVNY